MRHEHDIFTLIRQLLDEIGNECGVVVHTGCGCALFVLARVAWRIEHVDVVAFFAEGLGDGVVPFAEAEGAGNEDEGWWHGESLLWRWVWMFLGLECGVGYCCWTSCGVVSGASR